MGVENRDEPVGHPTWLEHIRFFFDAQDIECMKREMNMDLASYEGVKKQARRILMQTQAGSMPPQKDRRWPGQRVKTFENWIVDKFPMGAAPLELIQPKALALDTGPQKRRNAAALAQDEIELLKKAFRGVMDRDTSDPQSYFAIAGVHWFPNPHCVHHAPHYNPWHRVYIDRFEAALRSVEGCENVKLPYWDIVRPIPAWLFDAPFDSYTIPVDVSPQHPAGTKTQRHPKQAIEASIAHTYKIDETIRQALDAPQWEAFARTIEQAHDDGHVSIGPSGVGMGSPAVAAFDPLFWFFHCNWERLWWAWQERHKAGQLAAFRQTIDPTDTRWLDDPDWNKLEPFGVAADQTIDTAPYAYEDTPLELFSQRAVVRSGHVPADRTFRLGTTSRLSVRVKGIERLRIKGPFIVHLLGDGQPLARHAFFQAEEPTTCPNCLERAKVDIDLLVDRQDLMGKQLEIKLESLEPGLDDPWVPLTDVGSPTINVRELITSE